jgi:hypothetical protein
MFYLPSSLRIWKNTSVATRSWLGLGVKPEHNPLRLQFHYGYALREDSTPQNCTGERYAGYEGNVDGKKQNVGTDGWERELGRDLYPRD